MPTNRTKFSALPIVFLAASSLSFIVGCGGYPEVSPQTYHLARALNAVCDFRMDDKLGEMTDRIQVSLSNDDITTTEAGWLLEIVETARSGDWEQARSESRQMLADQVGR